METLEKRCLKLNDMIGANKDKSETQIEDLRLDFEERLDEIEDSFKKSVKTVNE
jgi:hypothetical protein